MTLVNRVSAHLRPRRNSHILFTFATMVILLASQTAYAFKQGSALDYWNFSVSPDPAFNTINVYSSDGTQWDTFSGAPLKFNAALVAKVKGRDLVDSWGLFLGYCTGDACLNFPQIAGGNPLTNQLGLWDKIQLPGEQIPIGLAYTNIGNSILSVCNDHLTPSVGALNDFSTNFGFQITAARETVENQVLPQVPPPGYEGGYFSNVDAVKHDLLPVSITCHGFDFDADEFDVPDPEVVPEEVELYLSTFSNAYSQPNHLTKCQKGRALVPVNTNQAGPVAVRLWTLGVNESESHLLNGWAAHIGSGQYQA